MPVPFWDGCEVCADLNEFKFQHTLTTSTLIALLQPPTASFPSVAAAALSLGKGLRRGVVPGILAELRQTPNAANSNDSQRRLNGRIGAASAQH